MAAAKVYHAVGKRKSAIARVYMKPGSGNIHVNEKTAQDYFPAYFQPMIAKALKILNLEDKYDAQVSVIGGGTSAQAAACMYGVAKALCLVSEEYRPPLKKAMLLTRDSRVVERKKYGHKKARRSFQFSKR
jgi:small subunit ribosomal protein S9